MTRSSSRRETLKGGLALAGAAAFGLPEWALPAPPQGDVVVPFSDMPENFPTDRGETRLVDVRKIDGPFTPADRFYAVQHYGQPEVDSASYRLKVSGLVDKPTSLSLAELRGMGGAELVAGFECSGNRPPLQALCSNGRWTGLPLRSVLERAGVQAEAREFVFLGADRKKEQVEFRAQKFEVEQQFGRSLPREKALSPEPFLAYALGGEPLTRHQGSPLRLIVPGWYGVANVKWLSNIHVQAEQYLGNFQARWYRTLKGEVIDGETRWKEAAITRMQLKSFIARVTKSGGAHHVLGVVLNDGTPLQSVEVRLDDGPWQKANLDPATNFTYSWKLFRYTWNGATAGEHTLVSRVTDVTGKVQPTAQELEAKKTFLEDNAQHPRTVTIA
jgi:DMSO/TMAO reductase YedYZ molybdopterin-dependent catalytic subunit